jgi:Uncharacterized conserved protein
MSIAVFGAYGYQGRLVLAELVRRGVEAVLLGRDRERLERAAAEAGVPGARVRVAATDDEAGLIEALRGCDAVISTAGPFAWSGGLGAKAAIRAGVHYVDTSGEQRHIGGLFHAFADSARAAGVAVVPAATDACVPMDLLASLIADRLGPLDELASTHMIAGGGGMSRGSLRSLLDSMELIRSGGLVYEDGDWRADARVRHTEITLPDAPEPASVARFPLPEVMTVPRHVAVRRMEGLVDARLLARLSDPPPAEAVDRLPAGPTEEERRTQRFTYVLDAVAADGRRARGVVRGTDTYGTTAVIAVESALRLAAGAAKPGVLAPAQAFDAAGLLDHLTAHGLRWSVEVRPADAPGW